MNCGLSAVYGPGGQTLPAHRGGPVIQIVHVGAVLGSFSGTHRCPVSFIAAAIQHFPRVWRLNPVNKRRHSRASSLS